jgi:hypothetical protein
LPPSRGLPAAGTRWQGCLCSSCPCPWCWSHTAGRVPLCSTCVCAAAMVASCPQGGVTAQQANHSCCAMCGWWSPGVCWVAGRAPAAVCVATSRERRAAQQGAAATGWCGLLEGPSGASSCMTHCGSSVGGLAVGGVFCGLLPLAKGCCSTRDPPPPRLLLPGPPACYPRHRHRCSACTDALVCHTGFVVLRS